MVVTISVAPSDDKAAPGTDPGSRWHHSTADKQNKQTNKQTNKSLQTSWAQQRDNWFNYHVICNARENRILASLTGSVHQARFRNPSNTRRPWNLGILVSKWGRDRAHDRAPFTNTVQLRSQHGHTITPITMCEMKPPICSQLQRCNRWSQGTDKQSHPTLNRACDYSSLPGPGPNHVSESGVQGSSNSNSHQDTCPFVQNNDERVSR